jgi:hypothetical protein
MGLLVGSVYIDHPRSLNWYKLQIEYLQRTTKDFTHVVYLNGKNDFYKSSKVLKKDTDPVIQDEKIGQRYHIRGLNTIVDYFNDNNQYSELLLLDSDCFPFKSNWKTDLDIAMKNYQVAALCRYENLDTFAHPAMFYIKKTAASNIKFDICSHKNLMGYEFSDTSSNVSEFFPLIRTNRLNYHPVLFGVYWNRFYHHGAGSRNLIFRLFYSYMKDTENVNVLEQKLFNKLCQNPDDFLSDLIFKNMSIKIF